METTLNTPPRKIIHIDMDSFFVAVELQDKPALQNKHVAVGGRPEQRGVIATCNYRARQCGVQSAMSSARAKQLCPDLIILPSNMAKYKQLSHQIQAIFRRVTDKVEPLSLDEAYLDVTEATYFQGSATLMARAIQRCIVQTTGLTASAGVGPNKLIAKIASEVNKPNGLCVVPPHEMGAFISALPVERLYGVGKVTRNKLHSMGVYTCQDLQAFERDRLSQHFGKFGNALYHYCRGLDDRLVNPARVRKSVSVERTYETDIADTKVFEQHATQLMTELRERIRQITQECQIKRIFVKVKFNDFQQTTAEAQASDITLDIVRRLLMRAYRRGNKPIRLMGVGVGLSATSHATTEEAAQINFDLSEKCNVAMRTFLEASGNAEKHQRMYRR